MGLFATLRNAVRWAGLDVGNGATSLAVVLVDPATGQPYAASGGGGGGGGSTVDREFVVSTYRARSEFTGASVGDTITATQIYNVTTATPSLEAVIWYNQTTTAPLASPPSSSNLELLGSNALTDAQLRAAPVVVSAQALTNLDADVGAITDAAAPADGSGNYSLLAAAKRALQNWSALLSRTPAVQPAQGTGTVNSGTMRVTISTDDPIDIAVGAPTDPVATNDTGPFSLISFAKRALQNWATWLSRSASGTPDQGVTAQTSRLVGQTVVAAGFSQVGASTIDQVFVQNPIVTGGTTYGQASGSLNVVAPAAAGAEFLARSVATYRGSMRMRLSTILSQRIANNNFGALLADLVGEGLAFTMVSATLVNVNLPSHNWTSQMVGQSVNLAGIQGLTGCVPGRYAVASIPDPNTIQFTVAGWPAAGSGTLTLFGRNYIRCLFTGTTPTSANFDAQRNGWASGDTVASINTTATPGTIVSMESTGRDVMFMDSLRASSVTPTFTTRASRYENIPDASLDLYIWLWSFNGSVAPVSPTTWSLAHLGLETFANLPVYVQGFRSQGAQNPIPVSGSVTVAQPTAASLNAQVVGPGAAAAAISGNPVRIGGSDGTNTRNILTDATGILLAINPLPTSVADVASAALTTSTTTAAFTPTWGNTHEINIPVTAVSGTSPTMDVSIEESDDGGTNWFKVYDFPRITAIGMYRSPKLPLTGNRVRYVQTVTGTTPSFTRSINRLQSIESVPPIRQLVDRTVNPNAVNSNTVSLNVQNCRNIQLVVNLGALTTAPSFQLQGSEDGGASWYNIGSPLAGVASNTVQVTISNVNAQLVRAQVSAAGAGVTLGYAQLKGF